MEWISTGPFGSLLDQKPGLLGKSKSELIERLVWGDNWAWGGRMEGKERYMVLNLVGADWCDASKTPLSCECTTMALFRTMWTNFPTNAPKAVLHRDKHNSMHVWHSKYMLQSDHIGLTSALIEIRSWTSRVMWNNAKMLCFTPCQVYFPLCGCEITSALWSDFYVWIFRASCVTLYFYILIKVMLLIFICLTFPDNVFKYISPV